jgi:NodT family efflux transporter outer membrane factor (OMF) lipoprotein
MNRSARRLLAALLTSGLSACAVGPAYERPQLPTPVAYKELGDWKPSEPADGNSRGPWWQVYKDPTLDELERQVEQSNQTLKAAASAYAQVRSAVGVSRAGFWPDVTADVSQQRSQRGSTPAQTSYAAAPAVSWEPDVWGRIRRGVEGSVASAQAGAADLASAQLSLQSTLATDYFELRVQDQLIATLDATVMADQQALQITTNRYKVGVAAKADVVTAETQWLTVQAQRLNLGILRAQLEHAIAVMTGKAPASFSIPPTTLATQVPIVPAGLPSALLERRPDIAQAERQVAAANANIGVARSAYFPTLTLSGTDSHSSSVASTLFQIPNRIWTYGPALAATLFDGGARRARLAQALAATEQSADVYRQTVLAAFQQVEDSLVNLRILEQQSQVEAEVVKSARKAEQLTLNQYKAGTTPYSSVITAQTTRLGSEQSALQVLRSRLTGSVALIANLGGDWDISKVPRSFQK